MSDIVWIQISVVVLGYVAIGYVIGIPTAALLDYVADDRGKEASTFMAISSWPVVVVIALFILPLEARDRLRLQRRVAELEQKK